MKKILLALCCFGLMHPAFSVPGDKSVMEGQYIWNSAPDEKGALKAEFTQTGDNQYDVSFYFKFRGKDYTYTGTAEGSLKDGDLKGSVLNETKRRTFTFNGTAKDGKFSGNHSEIRNRGKERATGSMTLNLS